MHHHLVDPIDPATSDPRTHQHNDVKPVSVLFVCLGNICRSTMAEACFRSLVNYDTPSQHHLIKEVDSCGTGAYHVGDPANSKTLSVLASNGIKGYKHRARKVNSPEDFVKFDYVIGMDADNVEDLRDLVKRAVKKGALSAEAGERVHLYGEFGGKTRGEEVADPYYGGREGFEAAYKQVTRFGKGLLEHIEEQGAVRNKDEK